ncbi:UbiA family prenyltransferase [Nonomuraea turcica]|uniref:UbiA family prenyltransferase n=1 Tax=Nonomuraea sp. G32 TaxID=3067274 RepID=UPI00273BFDC5|nr:UbiA family prenyltransferase [Nonomuraea sp. G32]MDP4503529.1 UbiA family prenyltransferase [Nonomuraea sp. G32]
MGDNTPNRSAALRRIPATAISDLGLCLSEARPIVQIIFLFRFLTGAALGYAAGETDLAAVGFGAFTWECAVVFVYLLNGATDVLEDRINGSRRPIASGVLPRHVALRYVRLTGVGALAGGIVMGWEFLVAVIIFMLLGYLYSAPPFQLKNNPGATIAVAALGGLVTYLAGSASAASGGGLPALVCAGAMSLWMGLVGAIAKDFGDIDGDRAAGRRTIAVLLGDTAARRLVGLIAPALGVAFVLAALHVAPVLIMSAVVTLLGAIVVAWFALTPARGDRNARRRPYRAFMTTQYGSHAGVALALTV